MIARTTSHTSSTGSDRIWSSKSMSLQMLMRSGNQTMVIFLYFLFNRFKDEKLIMKLWNHQLMVSRVLSQNQLLEACKTISQKYGKFIYKRNIRRNWLLHLLNLVDHCLLRASEVPKIMVMLGKNQNFLYIFFIKSFRSMCK